MESRKETHEEALTKKKKEGKTKANLTTPEDRSSFMSHQMTLCMKSSDQFGDGTKKLPIGGIVDKNDT